MATIEGLENLKGIKKLNCRARKDDNGKYHFELFRTPENMSMSEWETFKLNELEQNIVVDLAEFNTIETDRQLYDFYDLFWDMFHMGELDEYCGLRPRNGIHVCDDSADITELTLNINRYQLEMLIYGLYASTKDYGGDLSSYDQSNQELFNLIDQVITTRRERKDFNIWLNEQKNNM